MEKVLRELLLANGASLVGFANVQGLYARPDDPQHAAWTVPEYPRAVSIALAIPREIVLGIEDGPTLEYFDAYHSLNKRLDELAALCADHIRCAGYNAHAQTVASINEFGVYRTVLPHKTVAVRAGLGWIGKSALFISEQFGSAQRLTSVLTDAPIACYDGYIDTRCGNCMVCVKACPGKAISGRAWSVHSEREEYFDAIACRNKARELCAQRFGKTATICGKCIQVCPHTQRYLRRTEGNADV